MRPIARLYLNRAQVRPIELACDHTRSLDPNAKKRRIGKVALGKDAAPESRFGKECSYEATVLKLAGLEDSRAKAGGDKGAVFELAVLKGLPIQQVPIKRATLDLLIQPIGHPSVWHEQPAHASQDLPGLGFPNKTKGTHGLAAHATYSSANGSYSSTAAAAATAAVGREFSPPPAPAPP